MVNQNTREIIQNLNCARKGSLFEEYFKSKVDPSSKFARKEGVGADIRIDGNPYDLKMWRNKPKCFYRPILWLDYLVSKGKNSTIWLITKEKCEPFRSISNDEFELYLYEWLLRKKIKNCSDQFTTKGKSAEIKRRVDKYFQKYYPGRNRIIAVLKKTVYGAMTVAPEIVPDSTRKLIAYDRTILVVGDNNWDSIHEYWIFNHNEDIDKFNGILKDDGRNRNKKRVDAMKVPQEIKYNNLNDKNYQELLREVLITEQM